jgi:hypothetical protein
MSCASAVRDHIIYCILKDVFKHKLENVNNWEGRTGTLLYGGVITAICYELYWLKFVI